MEKVEHYMDEFKSKGEDEWIDKLYILKKMFKSFTVQKTLSFIAYIYIED